MQRITRNIIADYKSDFWQQEMRQCGNLLNTSHVKFVAFMHGTFAGNDPMGLYGTLKILGFSRDNTNLLKKHHKAFTDKQMGDLGNFPNDYVTEFEKGINHNIICKSLEWSSENNHIGRLSAVPKLARDLAEHLQNFSEKDRVLLIGHSHAGQLFSLLTLFLDNKEKAEGLLSILNKMDDFMPEKFSKDIQTLSNIQLDIVTLGTPVRYPWGVHPNYKLLSIVNDRTDNSRLDGILKTRDGDYVQQWGTEGTDLRPINNSLSARNNSLNNLLDKGVPSFLDRLKLLFTKKNESKRRNPIKVNNEPIGINLLINYTDEGDPVTTLLGHGCYTLRENMLFNLDIIIKNLYQADDG